MQLTNTQFYLSGCGAFDPEAGQGRTKRSSDHIKKTAEIMERHMQSESFKKWASTPIFNQTKTVQDHIHKTMETLETAIAARENLEREIEISIQMLQDIKEG